MGVFFKYSGKFFFLKVGTCNFICEIIFLFFIFKFFLFDLSIMHANPTILDLYLSTSFAHSKLDLPVVITSSTINTLLFFFYKKTSS